MLVLSRMERESITIVCPDGTRLSVKVANVRGCKVRLAFDLPREFQILRSELLEDKKREE